MIHFDLSFHPYLYLSVSISSLSALNYSNVSEKCSTSDAWLIEWVMLCSVWTQRLSPLFFCLLLLLLFKVPLGNISLKTLIAPIIKGHKGKLITEQNKKNEFSFLCWGGHWICLSWLLKLPIKWQKAEVNVRSMTISLSFCLLCMYLFLFAGRTLLCVHFLWLNGWIERRVVASLITKWPC